MTVGELKILLSLDPAGVASGTNQAESRLDALTRKVQGVGRELQGAGAVIGGIGAALLGAGAKAVQMAGEVEQLEVAFTTMLGDGEKAQKLLEDLQQFAASTPFQFNDIADAGRKLLAFGTEAENVTTVLRRVGDVAAGVGAPIGEIAELYGKAQVQGRLFAEDINQLTGRGIPIIGELAAQFGVADSEVRKLVEEGKVGFPELEQAFISLTATGGQFAGLMEAQSGTVLGLWSTLKDNIILTVQGIGDGIVEALDLKERMSGATDFLTAMRDKIIDFVKNNPKLVEFGAILATAMTVVGGLAAAIGTVMTVMNPWVLAIGAVAAGAALLIANWEEVTDWLQSTFPNAFGSASSVIGEFKDFIKSTIDNIASFWDDWGGFIIQVFKNAWDRVAIIIDTVLSAIGNYVSFWMNIFQGDWAGAWDSIKAFFGDIWNGIVRLAIGGVDGILAAIQKIPGISNIIDVQPLRDKLASIVPADEIVEQSDRASAAVGGFGGSATSAAGAASGASSAIRDMGERADEAGGKVKKASDEMSEFEEATRRAGNEFVDFLPPEQLSNVEEAELKLAALRGEQERNEEAMADLAQAARDNLRVLPEETGKALQDTVAEIETTRLDVVMATVGAASRDSFSSALAGLTSQATQELTDFLSFGTDIFGSSGLGGVVGAFADTFISTLAEAFIEQGIDIVGAFVEGAGTELVDFAASLGVEGLIGAGIVGAFFAVTTAMGADWEEFINETLRGIREIDDAFRDLAGTQHEQGTNAIEQAALSMIERLIAEGASPSDIREQLGAMMRQMADQLGISLPGDFIGSFIDQLFQIYGLDNPGPGSTGDTQEIVDLLQAANIPASAIGEIMGIINQALAEGGMDPHDLADLLLPFDLPGTLMSEIISIFENISSGSNYSGGPVGMGQLYEVHGLGTREWFIPSMDGYIATQPQLSQMMGSMRSSGAVHHHHVYIGNEAIDQRLYDVVEEVLR